MNRDQWPIDDQKMPGFTPDSVNGAIAGLYGSVLIIFVPLGQCAPLSPFIILPDLQRCHRTRVAQHAGVCAVLNDCKGKQLEFRWLRW